MWPRRTPARTLILAHRDELVAQAVDRALLRYDRNGDEHYDEHLDQLTRPAR